MAKKKAKWLEATTPELLVVLKEVLVADEVDTGKAQKIVAELIERLPAETDGELSVEDAISSLEQAFVTGLSAIQDAYKAELDAIGDSYENEEDGEGEDETPAPKKDKKEKKANKKSKKAAEPEEDEDGEDDGEETDYTEMSQKALKKECRARGLKINKSMGKADFIKALEADDKA
jgi:hypothetical protein